MFQYSIASAVLTKTDWSRNCSWLWRPEWYPDYERSNLGILYVWFSDLFL